jgi:hypothetical protein
VKSARQHLNDAVLDKDGGATAPDTFMRAVMALARLEATPATSRRRSTRFRRRQPDPIMRR